MRTFLLFTTLAVLLLAPSPGFADISDQPTRRTKKEAPKEPQLTKAPALLKFVEATYPDALLQQGIGGEVLMVIDIDIEGKVERIEVLEFSNTEFVAPATDAVSNFLFSPAEIDNKPSPIRIQYRYRFEARTPEPAKTNEPPPPPPITFQGKILEAGIREPIAGAIIAVDGKRVAQSDATGNFEVRGLSLGKHKVEISSPYHETYTLEETIEENIVLTAKYYLVRVSDDPYQTVIRGRAERREVSKVQLSREELSKVPGTFGDPIRVIENLPGLSRTPGGLGGSLLVRGANPSDSKVYVDGAEIPLIYHFGGLTSIINAEFLESIDFYPGGFSSRYGKAISGIVDVKTRDLDCESIHGSFKTDLVDTNAYICIPIDEWKIALAGRRSYVDAILPYALEAIPRGEDEGSSTVVPVYWDYQLKANRRAGKHTFDIFSFGSKDRFRLVQSVSEENSSFNFGLQIEQHRLVLRHRYRPSAKTTISSSIAPKLFETTFRQESEELGLDAGFKLSVLGVDLRWLIETQLLDWLTFASGVDIDIGEATVSLNFPIPTELKKYPSPTFDFTNTQPFDEVAKVFSHGYWAELILQAGESFKLIPGLRLQRFDVGAFQAISAQPRITGRWEVTDDTVLKGAFGIYDKAPEPRFASTKSGNPNLLPLRAQHYVLGFEHSFTELLQLDMQFFFNKRYRLPTTSNKVTYEDGQATYEWYNSDGSGRAYGLELLLRYLPEPNGWGYGWVSYTLSQSTVRDRRLDSSGGRRGGGGPENQGQAELETYLSNFDQPHILTVVGQFDLPWDLEFGFRFRYVSGNPTTDLTEAINHFDVDDDEFVVDADSVGRNSSRLPAFHQLDVRLDKNFTFDLWKFSVFLEVLNVYNASNVETFNYSYDYSQKAPFSLLPIVPVLGLKGSY